VPETPDTWDLAALRWLSRRYSGGTPNKANSAYWDDGDIPWLNSGAVNDGYITEPSEHITREGFVGSSAKWIPQGALVMALAGQGKTKGMAAQLGIDATCNQSMAAIIPSRRLQARYLYWWLTANYFNIRNMAGGEARDGLNLDLLGSIPCPVPSEHEQRAISTHLDRETAKIDTLVAKKRTLIERLKEKRTALISRTVTRGLPPDAARAAGLDPFPEFKPSGIDWIGDVPEHWGNSRLKHVMSRIADCPHETPTYTPGAEYFVIRTADVSLGQLDLSDALRVDEDEYFRRVRRLRLQEGDIVYGREGERWGFAASVPGGPTACLGQRMMQFRAGTRFNARFLMWHINAACVYQQGSVDTLGATSPHVNVETIRNYCLAEPPLDEQNAIAGFLDCETTTIDDIVAKIAIAIELLQEYRTTLITAAVAGKIKVWDADANIGVRRT